MKSRCPVAVCFTAHGAPKLLTCGKWSCPQCRKVLARQWAYITRYGIKHFEGKYGVALFWTFTLGSQFKTARAGYEALPKLWNKLRMAMQREHGVFVYLAFVEGQEKRGGMPHFHVITFQGVPRRWDKRKDKHKNIKDFAVHMGFGFMATETEITSSKASAYVSKYVSKGTPNIPRNFRRVRPCQDWPKPDKDSKLPYIVRSRKETLQDWLIRVQEASGRSLDDLLIDYVAASDQLEAERRKQ